MLITLFLLAAVVLVAAVIRRPRKTWERAVAALAGVLMLAVIVAWGIEYMVSNAKAAQAPAPIREGEVVPLDPILIDTPAFEIAGLTWTHHEKGVAVFNVQGVVTNKTQSERAVPNLRVALRDDAGKEIYHWTVAPAAARIAANARTSFDTRLENPPPHKDFALRFENPEQ
jgi:hypothetical protein